ncbi:NADH2 dehydrogenase [Dichomitus squalens]|uniref:NADH2 dehydrogenase n=1 Tax=Dichomitus squalens TaxID=114155 RepID=A0A4Q9N9D5_9APHY|nr:NADH2 dehydrogenase [Dichomitus squalens LYAD-421 SS1]EJF66661.1 NADH2 dehydrogenase [Dichomitus squalens LYAD-421 SS1]TBU35203.1 NADH2 dehydrogenase [Dichomitus squalens]TBU37379.1 NADH2 dehydrogenase [Dichomitus squalens]TBU65031.1 NADH2 dehydrogenase [Dichomitus squalens]
MLRFTRPLLSAFTKNSTGITGLRVHHDPLPELKKTYEATLQTLSAIPSSSVYRQGTEALTQHKLKVLERANGDVTAVEKELDEGQIEELLDVAQDELSLANKILEWKAWEPLEEKPAPGQWRYFGKEANATTSA